MKTDRGEYIRWRRVWIVMKSLTLLCVVVPSLLLTAAGLLAGPKKASVGVTTRPAATRPIAEVAIDNFSFSPASLAIAAGTTVTWINHDDVPHTIAADDHSFRSAALDTDDRYSRVFAKPGKYPYFCGIHPHMTGAIIVK